MSHEHTFGQRLCLVSSQTRNATPRESHARQTSMTHGYHGPVIYVRRRRGASEPREQLECSGGRMTEQGVDRLAVDSLRRERGVSVREP